MFEDKWSFNRIRSCEVGRRILRRIGIHRKGILRVWIREVEATGDGARLFALGSVHRRIEAGELDAIPEGAPYDPGLILVVDDEIGIDGVPVVTTFTGGDDTAFIVPEAGSQRTCGEQADGRAVASEGGAAVGEPPATTILDDIRCPHMMGEAWHGVVRPFWDDRHHGVGFHRPGLAVLRGHLLDTHACGEDIIGTVFEGHHWVVDHRRLRLEVSTLEVARLGNRLGRDKKG